MNSWLSNAMKRRLVKDLKQILHEHPRYRPDSQNVQNKYAFDERPSRGVIVNGTSADRVKLSADNYVGMLSSFVMWVPSPGHSGTTVEWVRENFSILEHVSPDRSVFPTSPGVYYFEVTRVPDEGRTTPGEVVIDPVLTVTGEPVIRFTYADQDEAQLSRQDVYPGSVRLWLDGRIALIPGTDFDVDHSTGTITFKKTTPFDSVVTADYRYVLPRMGPFPFYREQFDTSMIPGAVIAFGDRCEAGDRFAIVVTDERTDVAHVYGGKFEMNFELVAFSRDSDDREKLSDYIVQKVLELQSTWGYEGIELLDIAPGGENEDVLNPETDEYFYDSNIALSVRVDWSAYVPLPAVVWRGEMTSKAEEVEHGHLDGTYSIDKLVVDPSHVSSYVLGKRLTYERIR